MFLKRFKDLEKIIHTCQFTNEDKSLNSEQALASAHDLLSQTKKNNGIAYIIGNGGSAGIASHFCIDLLNALEIPSNTLFDSNMFTCIANDYGYENVFANPLKTLLKPNDLLVAISSSGSSPNILNAVKVANEKKINTFTLSGFDNTNPLRQMGSLNYYLNQSDYGLVEMGHFFLLHTIIDTWNYLSVKNKTAAFAHAKQD